MTKKIDNNLYIDGVGFQYSPIVQLQIKMHMRKNILSTNLPLILIMYYF